MLPLILPQRNCSAVGSRSKAITRRLLRRFKRKSRVTTISSNSSNSTTLNETTLELDSHADTCILGRDALIIQNFDRPVDVYGYDKIHGKSTYQTVSGVVAYHHPVTGECFHLVIHQAIHIPHLDHHLLCPMQCRVNDVTVNDCPKIFADDPTENTHALIFQDCPDDDNDGRLQTTVIPLELHGVTSLINVSKPTADEWSSNEFRRLVLTNEHLEWDPASPTFGQQEGAMTDYSGQIIDSSANSRGRSFVINALSSHPELANVDDDDNLAIALESHVTISSVDSIIANGTVRSRLHPAVDAATLAKRWCITPERAAATIERTTQRAVRTVLYPTLERRYSTNDRMLRYTRLLQIMFSDTGFANVKSQRGNKTLQIFACPDGWARAYPMVSKGDADEALSLLLQREGAPPAMVLDGSKEQTSRKFRKKLREAGVQFRQTEPYSPWQQAAEGVIRELKRASSRLMMQSRSPKVLWDHCIELAALIRSHTASNVYSAAGEVPETTLKGGTADTDISILCQFGWYDWVMFRDNLPSYPDDSIILGRYLGPAMEVGSAHTAKILKANGQVTYRSTLRLLTPEELASPEHAALRSEFDASILRKLGPHATKDDFPIEDITPDPDFVEDDPLLGDESVNDDNTPTPTPESGDQYLMSKLLFPRGNDMVRGKVISRKRDANGDPIGRAHDNPMLDTRVYNVEFHDGDIAELTANAIATSMYSQCDPEGNQFMLLDTFVGHRKNEKAITLAEQDHTDPTGRVRRRKSTQGWQICCQWRDGSTTWEELGEIRNS